MSRSDDGTGLMMPLSDGGKCPDVLMLLRDDWQRRNDMLMAGSMHVLAPSFDHDQVCRDIGVQLLPLSDPVASKAWRKIRKPPHIFGFWFDPEERCSNFDSEEIITRSQNAPVILTMVQKDYNALFWRETDNDETRQDCEVQRGRLRELHTHGRGALMLPRHRHSFDNYRPELKTHPDGHHRTLSLRGLL